MHVSKDHNIVSIPFLKKNLNDTSKIQDGDDGNPRDKIFQTQIGKKD